jgi:hypothetical protein
METIEPQQEQNFQPDKLSIDEYIWCQELATTLDPFSRESLTPRQTKILKHFNWLSLVGPQGFELTQLILQKLHAKAQDDLQSPN